MMSYLSNYINPDFSLVICCVLAALVCFILQEAKFIKQISVALAILIGISVCFKIGILTGCCHSEPLFTGINKFWSNPMLLLLGGIPPLVLLLDCTPKNKPGIFYGLLFLTQGGMFGNLISQDLITFYVFWELMLIPVFFLMGLYGGKRRINITLKFVVYTIFGSLFMLGAIAFMKFNPAPSSEAYEYCSLAFLLAILIKIPVFPFHTWQRETYYQAPTAVTIYLSALMSKLGIVALFKFVIFDIHLRLGFTLVKEIVVFMAIISIIYGCFLAWKELNVKKMLAYSSLSHVNYSVLGISLLTYLGMSAGVVQMLSHGLISTGLFLSVARIRDLAGSYKIQKLSGLAKSLPKLAFVVFIFFLAGMAMPLTSGFIAELMVMQATFMIYPEYIVILFLAVVFTGVYFLSVYRRIFFGVPSHIFPNDISNLELCGYLFLFGLIVLLGIFPNDFILDLQNNLKQFYAGS